MTSAPERLVADRSAAGDVAELTAVTDRWLAGLFEAACGERDRPGLALVAVGGHGRAELCPGSDLDVMLLHRGRRDVAEIAEAIWYPVWDTGLALGHSVRTPKEALRLAADDLDTATSLLDVRLIAGDRELAGDLSQAARNQWAKRARRHLEWLEERVRERQARSGEVAVLLEPDVKEGRGGLRDVHALRWAEAGHPILSSGDDAKLADAHAVLVSVRFTLHRLTGRSSNVLVLQEQDAVAAALGWGDGDALLARVAGAARTISWLADEAWERATSWRVGPAGASRPRSLAPGIELRDGVVHVAAEADVAHDPVLALRAAAAAARAGTRLERQSLQRLATEAGDLPSPWPPALKAAWDDLLGAGRAGLPVIEALDQVGLWERWLPEWKAVRNRPQRNAYHTFTVDRHLLETVANAAERADRVDRPDLLLAAALLHDLGKVGAGDHTAVGVELAETVGARMGFASDDVTVLQKLVRHHLLLSEVATRRDLSDGAVIERVASELGSLPTLDLLAALTEADSLATGPAAWSPWKAQLMTDLVAHTRAALGGPPVGRPPSFPSAADYDRARRGETSIVADGDTLTLVVPDRPGLFSRVAGVLALHGLAVLAADATSSEGMALTSFRVTPAGVGRRDGGDRWTDRWPEVIEDVHRALAGRLALAARVADRDRLYRRSAPSRGAAPPRVVIDDQASPNATVVEVYAPDSVGLLYRVTRAISDLDLDLRTAKVETLGDTVVDAFYVRPPLVDADHRAELTKAILHAVDPG